MVPPAWRRPWGPSHPAYPLPGRAPEPIERGATNYLRLPRTLNWAWWRPLVAIVIGAVLVGVATMAVLVGAVVLALVLGVTTLETMDAWVTGTFLELDAADPFAIAVTLGSIAIWIPCVQLALLCAGMRPIGHVSSVAYRLRWRWLAWCLLPALLALAISMSGSLGIAYAAGEQLHAVSTPLGRLLVVTIVILLLVPFQAAAEEYVFRGALAQALGSWVRSPWLALLLPTLLFTLGHIYDIWGMLDVAVFGIAAAILTWRTGGLEAAIALHVVNNVVAFLFLASGISGTTVASADVGSPITLVLSIATTLLYMWIVLHRARSSGLATTSIWPDVTTSPRQGYVPEPAMATPSGGSQFGVPDSPPVPPGDPHQQGAGSPPPWQAPPGPGPSSGQPPSRPPA